jgi:hypothetical protein
MNIYLQFISVFFAVTIIDICWAFYIPNTSEGRAMHAASWSALIMVFSGYTTTSYVHHPVLIIAAALGAFNGTYWTVRYKNKKK